MAFGRFSKPAPVNLKRDTLDFAPALAEAKANEAATAEQFVRDVNELQATPDLPKRWGNRGPLTVASPGSIVEDPTYIPEYVTTHDGRERCVARHRIINGQLHILTPDSQRKYRWTLNDPQKFALHKRRGYQTSRYSELFVDTGLYENGPGDQVRNGDLILMEISMDGWERMCKEKLKLQAALEGAYGSELFSEGARTGTPTFQDDLKRGVREFYT